MCSFLQDGSVEHNSYFQINFHLVAKMKTWKLPSCPPKSSFIIKSMEAVDQSVILNVNLNLL